MATPKSLDLARRLWGWQPHSDGQREWMLCDARVKVAACGRRWGKSESSAVDIVLYALEHPGSIQIVIAPSDDHTKILMSEVQRRLYAIPGMASCVDERLSPYWEFKLRDGHGLITPTTILARTAGVTGKGLRGRKAHRVIVDEAAFISDAILQNVVTPLLADYDGQLVQMSTPNGLNHFYQSFQRGRDDNQPRYAAFQFPTDANPYIPRAYLDAERATKPERTFWQEYEARFLELEGAVFRKVLAAIRSGLPRAPQKEHTYIAGVDWGRTGDFTAIAVYDSTLGEIAYIDRFNQIDFDLQLTRLTALHERYGCAAIVAEQNSIGIPQIERMQRQGLPVRPFVTTNATKAELIDTLALALEREEVGLPDDPTLIAELQAFQCERLPSGLLRYGAPEGQHDDCVIGVALAVWGGRAQLNLTTDDDVYRRFWNAGDDSGEQDNP